MLDFEIKIDPATGEEYLETAQTGKSLLTIPQFNKSTAFTREERIAFHLRGKLPAHIETLDNQIDRAYAQYQSYPSPLHKNTFLNKLHDSNLILFYGLVKRHIGEMIPILYTPTVGEAVIKFSREFQQARGLYISYEQRDYIDEILKNRSHPDIDIIVVSDGGGVLGIGDQGVGAMMIPVAKLMVYTLCGGIHPLRTLPILLDVGTDNEILQQDPMYLGSRHPRLRGPQYDEFIARFVEAVKRQFPHTFLHWEDFGKNDARRILNQYRDQLCTFNDDIQGTGVVALSALLAAMQVCNSKLSEQRIVILGAGTAGLGVADQICAAMQREGLSESEAHQRFWLLDRNGLVLDHSNLNAAQQPYARDPAEISNWTWDTSDLPQLLDIVRHVKPTVLIGCSTATGAFNEDVVTEMAKHTPRPIIFPLSNPTYKSEAVPEDLLKWTRGQALIATGSPFPPAHYNGRLIHIAQSNNALVFPGLGLGITAVGATHLSHHMLFAACDALGQHSPIHHDPSAALLPPIEQAEDAARAVAIAVAKQAVQENLAILPAGKTVEQLVDARIWQPHYLPYRKRG